MLSEDLPVTDQSTGSIHFFLVLPKYILKMQSTHCGSFPSLISPPPPLIPKLCALQNQPVLTSQPLLSVAVWHREWKWGYETEIRGKLKSKQTRFILHLTHGPSSPPSSSKKWILGNWWQPADPMLLGRGVCLFVNSPFIASSNYPIFGVPSVSCWFLDW